ncbi:MAG: tyrosine-type recombinase/integrase [Bacteroidota bacterium]|nr:tyrosine-type recombinase/integrase [Bacteroidota bacterium]
MIEFYLNQPYKKGTHEEMLQLKREGKSVKSLLSDKPSSIYLYVYIQKSKERKGYLLKYNTLEKVRPTDWDFEKRQKRSNIAGSIEFNLLLSELHQRVTNAYISILRTEPGIQIQHLKEKLRQVVYNTQPVEEIHEKKPDIYEIYQIFFEEKKIISKLGTVKKYKTLVNILKDYEKYTRTKLNFDSFDFNFDIRFRKFLFEERNHFNDTVSKYYESLKVFLNWAFERKYHQNETYHKYKSERTESNRAYLTLKELRDIQNVDLEQDKKLSLVRDYFLFQCWTGQRFSDIENLKWEDLELKEDGVIWHLWQIKGNKKVKVLVPLSKDALSILANYKKEYIINGMKVFPTFHNVTTNRFLKEICKRAGLNDFVKVVRYKGKQRIEKSFLKWQKISTHCARVSFVTLSLEKGLRPEIVQSITGHEDYKTMKKYLKITDMVKVNEFRKVWDS